MRIRKGRALAVLLAHATVLFAGCWLAMLASTDSVATGQAVARSGPPAAPAQNSPTAPRPATASSDPNRANTRSDWSAGNIRHYCSTGRQAVVYGNGC